MISESVLLEQTPMVFPMLDRMSFQTQRGRAISARPIAARDTGLIATFLGGLSARSLFLRYFMPMPRPAPEFVQREITRLGQADHARQLIAVAFAREQGVDQVIAVAELVRDERANTVAELALVVADAYQREGIGSALCTHLIAAARQHGIGSLRANILPENTAIRRLIAKSGVPYKAETRQGMTTIQIDLARVAFGAGLLLDPSHG